MAYSLMVTSVPVNGLYISFFPLLIYFLLGTSKHLAIGAIAIISLLSGAVVDKTIYEHSMYPLNITDAQTNSSGNANMEFRVKIASSLSLLVGLIQLGMGLSGLGVLATYLSDTFISGYTCASAFHVIVSQVKDLLGMRQIKKFEGLFRVPKVNYL
jgi:MFS superfamily sulfate permease-like transporter